MSLSKKLRFEVFKRDGFKCAYCGKSPPTVTLEVDHIEPVSKGGMDDINNLITACFDCNRGKRDIPLDKAPGQLSENLEVLREREEQIQEYRRLTDKIEWRIKKDIRAVAKVFEEQFPERELTEKFRNTSIRLFLQKLPLDEVVDAMRKACGKLHGDSSNAVNYFCGICWNKIKHPDGGH